MRSEIAQPCIASWLCRVRRINRSSVPGSRSGMAGRVMVSAAYTNTSARRVRFQRLPDPIEAAGGHRRMLSRNIGRHQRRRMMHLQRFAVVAVVVAGMAVPAAGQKYADASGKVRVALAKQPLSPNGPSKGPATMAEGGIQKILEALGATVRVQEAQLTPEEALEYGGWKKLGMSLGHFADIVAGNEREGYFTVGLLATCPSMPGLVAGLQHSGPTREPIKVGMLWLDAHPDFNTPETTRSGSLGGMPVAVATGRALQVMRLDAKLDPPLPDRHIVMGGVRLTDPLEQHLLDNSMIEQLSVDDLRRQTPAVWAQLDRLDRLTDKIYVHIDMDVLDPREVMGHGNKVPNGPSSEQLAALFEAIFAKYPKASAIGFATIPPTDEGGLSIAALNRMIAGAVRGVKARPR